MPNRTLEHNLVRLIIILAFLFASYFAIQELADVYSGKLVQKMGGPEAAMKENFLTQINNLHDPYKAVSWGQKFTQSQNNDLALAAFTKATNMDPEYRDAWVGRGFAELNTNQPAAALESLKKAEAIDPINPRTYELLKIAYEQTGDVDNAKKAEEKFQYLTKSQ